MNQSSTTSPRIWRQRLLMLRGLLIVILALAFALAWSHRMSPLPMITVLFWLLLLWMPSLLYLASRQVAERWQIRWLNIELCLDTGLFLGLLYQIGGAGNPIIFYLLLPVLIAALALPARSNAVIAILAVAGYASTPLWQQPVDSHHLHALHDVSHTHEIGMWLIFVILVVVFSVLGQALQQAARRSQRQQAMALSIALQRERMYQIAADLADRAHEINTPLTTLMLLTEEPPDSATLQQDWRQIHALVERMASILRQSTGKGSQPPQPLSGLVADLQKNLRMLAPTLVVSWHGPADPLLAPTESWQRILANLGYNACDAGATTLDVRCEKLVDRWLIQVSDNGPRQRSDDPSRQGLGLGLALIETTLAALGASLQLLFDPHWTVARIELPFNTTESA
jgi:two-component system, sensor histidine kinase RegB